MSHNHHLLIFIMHKDILLTQTRILASITNEVNQGGLVLIAIYNDEKKYDIKRLSRSSEMYEQYINKSIIQDELVRIVQLIQGDEAIKTTSLCCHANLHANLTTPEENRITSQTHEITKRLRPNRLMLISSANEQCFQDSELYASGKPSFSNFTLPFEIKAAVVISRRNIIEKINQELKTPTWIRSRTRGYVAQYYFSCFFSTRGLGIGLDPLDDDDCGDEDLYDISKHPDNSTQRT